MTNESNYVESTGDAQPSDSVEVTKLVKEFVNRAANIKNEISLLKQDEKALEAEFKEKLDMKSFKAALRIIKIKASVSHRDGFDSIMAALESDGEV